jgi:hypothetical protein
MLHVRAERNSSSASQQLGLNTGAGYLTHQPCSLYVGGIAGRLNGAFFPVGSLLAKRGDSNSYEVGPTC